MELVKYNIKDIEDIVERNYNIQKINEDTIYIYELYKELNLIVDLQQEKLDNIQLNFDNSYDYIEHAEIELGLVKSLDNNTYKTYMITGGLVIIGITTPLSIIAGTKVAIISAISSIGLLSSFYIFN